MSKIIGIDLWDHQLLFMSWKARTPSASPILRAGRTTSVVAFTDKERLVGEIAKRQGRDQPQAHHLRHQASDGPQVRFS